jgi:hypothetical protein
MYTLPVGHADMVPAPGRGCVDGDALYSYTWVMTCRVSRDWKSTWQHEKGYPINEAQISRRWSVRGDAHDADDGGPVKARVPESRVVRVHRREIECFHGEVVLI